MDDVAADICLINPGAAGTIYQDLANTLSAIEPPTWLRMNAGYLLDRGHRVHIIDQDAMRWTPQQVAERVERLAPSLTVTVVSGQQPSASTQQMVGASAVVEAIHARNPARVQTLLGHHVSAIPEQTLLDLPTLDFVIDGEGPHTLASMLEHGITETTPGLVRRGDTTVHHHPRAPVVPIDEMAGNVWDLLPMARYRAHAWQTMDGSARTPYASIYTTLGCPFKCRFCMINVIQHSNAYRRRSPDSVVEQIELLAQRYGIRTLKIADEMFVLDPSHYLAVCERLAALPYAEEMNIWAYARIDTVKPETLALLRRAGIRWLALGIESGSAHVRDGASKSLNAFDIEMIVQLIQRQGINVIGNFIFGLPDDTLATMADTLELAQRLNCEFANFYSAMAYPGSRLFTDADPKDLPASWSGYSQHSHDCRPLPTATLTSSEVLAFRDAAHVSYFSSLPYLDTIDRKFGPDAVRMIMSEVAQPLARQAAA